VDTWERIKWPRAALDDAKVSAARLPLKPFRCYSAKYGLFVSVAGYRLRSVKGPILLPCRKMATLLECDPMTVSRYRRLAVQDGLLRLTARGIKAQRKADKFSFAAEFFNWKTGEQISSVTLNICVTPSATTPECYTEKQDTQDSERHRDTQETGTLQEVKDKEVASKPSPKRFAPTSPNTRERPRKLRAESVAMSVTTNTTAPMAKTSRGRRRNSPKCQGELTSSDPMHRNRMRWLQIDKRPQNLPALP
jgi:hypothetical protein